MTFLDDRSTRQSRVPRRALAREAHGGTAPGGADMRAIAINRAEALRRVGPPLGWPQLAGLLAALGVSLVLGYVIFARLTTPAATPVQTVAVTRGPIAAGVSGTGSVVAD